MDRPQITPDEFIQLTDFTFALGEWIMGHDGKGGDYGAIEKQYANIKRVLKKADLSAAQLADMLCDMLPYSITLKSFKGGLAASSKCAGPPSSVNPDSFRLTLGAFGYERDTASDKGKAKSDPEKLDEGDVRRQLAERLHEKLCEQNRATIQKVLRPTYDDGVQQAVNTLALAMTYAQTRGDAGCYEEEHRPIENALSKLDETLVGRNVGEYVRRVFDTEIRNAIIGLGIIGVKRPLQEDFELPPL